MASLALRRERAGVATCWNADVVATAKRDLAVGERLGGEGGYTVWNDVAIDATTRAYAVRREMEAAFAPAG